MAFKSGRFFKDVDRMVSNGLIPKMDSVVNKGVFPSNRTTSNLHRLLMGGMLVFPIFLKHSKALLATERKSEDIDFF